jgi:DNA polymerase-4
MNDIKQIIHVDMDAFYASIEQRDHPELQRMPVIVGGSPDGRGVVMTCSYETRKYGIHSAMPAKKAIQLCPQAIFVKPRFEAYKEASEIIQGIFHEYTDHVQPVSLDEAYLDVTNISNNFTKSKFIAQEILNKIYERTKLPASAGVSFNKFLAKIGSDYNKPKGITVITLDNADDFIDNLPIGKFYGVGKKTEKRLLEFGIKNGADLKRIGPEKLKKLFGKMGEYFYNCAIGIDNREVSLNWSRKSLSSERTLARDIDDKHEMIEILQRIANRIEEYLRKKELRGRTISLKMRYQNYQRISRSITLIEYIDEVDIIMDNIKKLLEKTEAGKKRVRLLGIKISNFQNKKFESRSKQTVFQI